jgi:hypothetical protein
MRLEEARGFMMQALRRDDWNQVNDLFRGVAEAQTKTQHRPRTYASGAEQSLEKGDRSVILEVIWSLIVQGILVPGLDDSNQTWPFLRLTEYGKRCVEEDRFLPHDPDGYISELQQAVLNVDKTITEYVTESLQCYIHGLNRAAAVMLGGASEKAVLLLIEAYRDSIGDDARKQRFESEIEKAQSIFRKYDLFDKQFSTIKRSMPKPITENIDSLLRGVFDLIRNIRNEAGHPASGTFVDRDVVYSHLRLFIPYCQRIYGLIGWFQTNTT